MSKYVSVERLHRAVLNLPNWRSQVHSQGAMHLWHFLTAKFYGVNSQQMTPFGEQDDREFWDNFMRVQDTNEPYYDPLDAGFRIATHYHSNVATARKKTFANTWEAATFEAEGDQEYWRFTDGYLEILEEKMLFKGGKRTRVPVFDVVAWLYRLREFADDFSLDELLNLFRDEFNLGDTEFSTLFTTDSIDGVPETRGGFFADHRISHEMTLAIITEKEQFDLADTLAQVKYKEEVQPVDLEEVAELVRKGRRQLILQGPPGTGKTYMARQVAALLLGAELATVRVQEDLSEFLNSRQFSEIGESDVSPGIVESDGGTWDIVQFHPGYTYDDFVRGIVSTIDNGTPVFRVENRIFGTLAELSCKVDFPVVLIIDEINRVDLSKVLGELIFALEYRGEAVRTPYELDGSALLRVGRNFFLLATMNTADRSIALVDYAIRRRFDFVELHPDRDVLADYLERQDQIDPTDRILELFDAISNLFEPEGDFAVGHAYLMGADTKDIARRVVFQVLPLLVEYQKEGVLAMNVSIPLSGWPGASGLPLKHPRPFLLATELKSWLDGGQVAEDEVQDAN